jgi:hemolysin activation/secretion protein
MLVMTSVRAEKPAFPVLEYDVVNNTKLATIAVEQAVYPYLGEHKTIDDIDKARAALEEAYHKAGYPTVMVDIPQQKVAGGIVKLAVSEGTIGKVRVIGSRYYDQGRILEQLPQLAKGNVLNAPQLQTEMNSLNRVGGGGRAVVPVLRPGTERGTTDVDLRVRDENPLHANLELNNYYSPNTSHTRLNAMLRYDNLWQREHSVTLQYQTAPEHINDVKVWSGTYVFHLNDPDKVLAFYAVHSNSNVSTVGDLSVLGNGNIYGARAVLNLPGDAQFSHTLSLGVDYKDFGQSLLLGADSIATPIHYLPFQVQYGATQSDTSSTTQLNVAANFSLRGVGNDAQQFEDKRFKARADYFYLRGDVQRTQNFANGMGLFVRIGGQFASQPLIGNEEYSGGGVDSVRGYLETETLGDSGLQSTLEWRTRSYAGKFSEKVQDFHLLAFADGVHLWIKDALAGQADRYRLASTGIGLRLNAWKRLKLVVDQAYPLRDGVYTKRGDWRTELSISYDLL